jgi:hypothetical protein
VGRFRSPLRLLNISILILSKRLEKVPMATN